VDRANPLPLLLPAIDLLDAVGQQEAAVRILAAVEAVLSAGKVRTTDLGGTAGTMDMARAVAGGLS
jgi:isocitrate/isopropylmalate dehydrogenase